MTGDRPRRLVPTEDDIIKNSKPNHLYNHEFEKGRFFQVVHDDDEGFVAKLSSKTMLKAVYIKEKDDIEGIEIIKLIGDVEKQRVKFSKFNLAQLKAFLSFLDQTDLAAISEKRIKIADAELTPENIKLIKTLLAKEGGQAVVESIEPCQVPHGRLSECTAGRILYQRVQCLYGCFQLSFGLITGGQSQPGQGFIQ